MKRRLSAAKALTKRSVPGLIAQALPGYFSCSHGPVARSWLIDTEDRPQGSGYSG